MFSPSHRPLKRCGDACESVSVGAVEASVRSSLGVGVGVRDTHLAYIYICRGEVADTGSQPASPSSKYKLGRLDTRLRIVCRGLSVDTTLGVI